VIPGLKIFWFAYQKDHLNAKYAQIGNYPKNCVAYTTTHDTQPLIGYFASLTAEQKKEIAAAAQVLYDDNDLVFAAHVRNAILTSPAETVIIPIQDWLLTNDRINIPGTEKEIADPNWHYIVSESIEDLPITF
jgi:4-alpha-glucanotransferase